MNEAVKTIKEKSLWTNILRNATMTEIKQVFFNTLSGMEEITIKCEVDEEMFATTTNPWNVVSLQEFLFFNCPECDFSCQDESIFHSHAIKNHEQAREYWWLQDNQEQPCLLPQQSIDLAIPQITTVDSAPLFESLGSGFSEMSEFNAKPVQCWLCNLVFDKEGHRNVHLMEDHFQKELSAKKSTTISVPKGPVMKIKGSDYEPLKCPFCWVISKNVLRFNNHLFAYHTKEDYKLYLKDVNDQVPHKSKAKSKCPECLEVFANKKLLEQHVKIHNIVLPKEKRPKQQSKCVCDLCGFVGSVSGYNSHMFYKHEQTEKALAFCQKCDGKPFLNKSDLKRHLAVKHDEDRELCTHCGKNFSELSLLKRHLASVHKIEDGVKRYMCSECNYTGLTNQQLKRHVFYSHQREVETGFVCDHCGKNWFCNYDRQHHINVSHLGVKKYQCEHCDYVANNLERIRKHTHYKHQDVSVRTCPVCGTVEKSAADLLRHYESSHPGHPPLQVDEKYVFRCDLCNKILGCALALFTHKRNTHNIKDPSILVTKKTLLE